MSKELTYEQASRRLKELQYAKAQMGQLSINDEIHKKALELAVIILEQQERAEAGWIDWDGTNKNNGPLSMFDKVQIKRRDGGVRDDINTWDLDWYWHGCKSPWDIIAYRIIPERATNQNGEQ